MHATIRAILNKKSCPQQKKVGEKRYLENFGPVKTILTLFWVLEKNGGNAKSDLHPKSKERKRSPKRSLDSIKIPLRRKVKLRRSGLYLLRPGVVSTNQTLFFQGTLKKP